MKNIVFIVLAIFTYNCGSDDPENCHQFVEIFNNSNKIIYFEVNNEPIVGSNPTLSGDHFKISTNMSKNHISGRERGCYEDDFAGNVKVYFNIFDEQVLLNNTWEEVRADDLVLKRFSFTLQEMQDADWKVVYDGN